MKTKNMKKLFFLLISLIMTCTIHAQWTQIGNNINGENSLDYSGYSVSLSSNGSIIAIGSPENDENGDNSGNVRVYENIGGNWVQMGTDIDGENIDDEFGYSVSLNFNGTIVAIGAYNNSESEYWAGHVRIYEYIAGDWVQIGEDIDGEYYNDHSGNSISLSSDGSIIAIGALYNDGDGIGNSTGHVRIYKFNGNAWYQLGNDINGEAQSDMSGYSVDLSTDGSIVAIGAVHNDGNEYTSNCGHTRVYRYNGISWVQIGGDIDGEDNMDYFGSSVALNSDGRIVAIGALNNIGNSSSATGAGHVRIFEFDGINWIQMGSDIDGESALNHFGKTVSLSSDGYIVSIGAYNGGISASGQVKVFQYINENWSQIGNSINGEFNLDHSGIATLNSDGSILAIGGVGNDDNGTDAGHVRVFNFICNINILDTSITQIGNTLYSNLNGARYQWVRCDSNYTNLIGENDQLFTPTTNGNYAVIISYNTCYDTSSCYTITAIDNIENLERIAVFPNPTKGVINIEVKDMESIKVIDLRGRQIYKGKENEIDLSQEPNGIYIIKVTTDKQTITRKLIKQ